MELGLVRVDLNITTFYIVSLPLRCFLVIFLKILTSTLLVFRGAFIIGGMLLVLLRTLI